MEMCDWVGWMVGVVGERVGGLGKNIVLGMRGEEVRDVMLDCGDDGMW